MHDQDILDDVFRYNVFLDNDFAQKLNLFDILNADCFDIKSELGNAILQLCSMAEMKFIVAKKCYIDKKIILINFEVCHNDFEDDCLKELIRQTIND